MSEQRPAAGMALGLLAIAAAGCAVIGARLGGQPGRSGPGSGVRNVILVIGDGMGVTHVQLARNRRYGPSGRLHFERLPVVGLVSTFAAEGELVTDSAAAATAMATGQKTRIGSVGIDSHGAPCRSLLEAAHARGIATGMVTSGALTNATTAAFVAHVASREDYASIARRLAESPADLLVGSSDRIRDADGNGFDVLERAREHGYDVRIGEAAFLAASRRPVLALIDGMDGQHLADGVAGAADGAPRLAHAARKALELLSSADRGFFLLLEEDGIDTFSHDNGLEGAVGQVLELDDAVEAVVDFARRDPHTLVVVTADHETGGLSIVEPSTVSGGTSTRWATGEHTGAPVALYAFGPGAREFAGALDNTDLHQRIGELLGLDEFPACAGSGSSD